MCLGFSAAEVLYDGNGGVRRGVATRDAGRNEAVLVVRIRAPEELLAKQTLLRRGARLLQREVMAIFDLRKDCDPQQFAWASGVWEIPEVKCRREIGPAHDRLAPDVCRTVARFCIIWLPI